MYSCFAYICSTQLLGFLSYYIADGNFTYDVELVRRVLVRRRRRSAEVRPICVHRKSWRPRAGLKFVAKAFGQTASAADEWDLAVDQAADRPPCYKRKGKVERRRRWGGGGTVAIRHTA